MNRRSIVGSNGCWLFKHACFHSVHDFVKLAFVVLLFAVVFVAFVGPAEIQSRNGNRSGCFLSKQSHVHESSSDRFSQPISGASHTCSRDAVEHNSTGFIKDVESVSGSARDESTQPAVFSEETGESPLDALAGRSTGRQ